MYKVKEEIQGKEISLFVKGLPSVLVLSSKLSQKVLKQLHEIGLNGIYYEKRNTEPGV